MNPFLFRFRSLARGDLVAPRSDQVRFSMLRPSPIRTSVERTVASATTGTVSDGGCDSIDMGDGTYWLRVGNR